MTGARRWLPVYRAPARRARWASTAHGAVSGTVRLTASQPVACFLLPPILARMQPALPAVQVELVVRNAVGNPLRRAADIALRMVAPDQPTLVAKRIGKVTLGACACWRRRPACTPSRPGARADRFTLQA